MNHDYERKSGMLYAGGVGLVLGFLSGVWLGGPIQHVPRTPEPKVEYKAVMHTMRGARWATVEKEYP